MERRRSGRWARAALVAVICATAMGVVAPSPAGAELPAQLTRITQDNGWRVDTHACKSVVDTDKGPQYRITIVAVKEVGRYGFSQVEIRVPDAPQVVVNASPRILNFWDDQIASYDLLAGDSPSNIVRAYPDDAVLDDRLDPYAARWPRISAIAWCDGGTHEELTGSPTEQFDPRVRNYTFISHPNTFSVLMYACRRLVEVDGQQQFQLTVIATNPTADPAAFSQISIRHPDAMGQNVYDSPSYTQWWNGVVHAYEVPAGTDERNLLSPFPDSLFPETAENPTHHRFPRVGDVSWC